MQRLSKLKYFCEVCAKPCRDANGYKCHIKSDAHKRANEEYSKNAEKYVDEFSRQFEDRFFAELEGQWLVANEVYSGIVRDADHVRLKATKWQTLTEFLRHAESLGKVLLRPDPRKPSCFEVQLIDLEKEKAAIAQEAEERKKRDREEKRLLQMEQEKRAKLAPDAGFSQPTNLSSNRPASIQLQFGAPRKALFVPEPQVSSTAEISFIEEKKTEEKIVLKTSSVWDQCVVKCLYGEFSGHKAVVLKEHNGELEVQLLTKNGTISHIKLQDTETVIPNLNRRVRVVNGPSKGKEGSLLQVDIEGGVGTVFFSALDESQDFRFNDICKIHTT